MGHAFRYVRSLQSLLWMTFRATGLITKTSMPRISSGRKDKMPVSIGATQESNFANPIGLLTDCHRRIERFLGVLVRVAAEARGGPLNAEHRQAMETALSYFHRAAPLHTADEEEDLFPELRRVDRPDHRANCGACQSAGIRA